MKTLYIFLLFLFSMRANAQWEQCDGIYGGFVRSLASSGNYIYAGTAYNGVQVSSNNGTNWSQTTLNNTSVYSLATSGNNVFAGTDGNHLYYSSDYGASWVLQIISNSDPQVFSLAISGNTIYAGLRWGVYYSTNNGTNLSLIHI